MSEKLSGKEKTVKFWEKYKKKLIAGGITAMAGALTVILYGKNQKLRGENENLKTILYGKDKIIERQAYIMGKQNQKLYGS